MASTDGRGTVPATTAAVPSASFPRPAGDPELAPPALLGIALLRQRRARWVPVR